MKVLYTALLALFVTGAFSQNLIQTRFVFQNGNQPFLLNEVITAHNGVNYRVENMAFFMSRVELVHDGGQVTALDTNDVFYVNYNTPVVDLGEYGITTIEAIRFDVGVPPHLNHLDISQYPEHHPLSYHDPSMHWGWAAGYIHMLMNGWGDDDNDGVPNVTYQLNCLGDENVFTVEVATTATVLEDGSREIVLLCNVDQWLRNSNPATTGSAHGSNGINAVVMNNLTIYPVFVSPANAAVTEKETMPVTVAQTDGSVTVSWDVPLAQSYRLVDTDGRVLEQGECNGQSVKFSNLRPGLHVVQLVSDQSVVVGTAKWIVP
jgi:hypothetical protein